MRRGRLLLVTLGTLAVAASAQAAERKRPMPPEDKVVACPEYGPGFVRVPGTATCVRGSGRVQMEYEGGTRRGRRDDRSGLGAQGRLAIDTRTETEYGPVRSYVRVKGSRD